MATQKFYAAFDITRESAIDAGYIFGSGVDAISAKVDAAGRDYGSKNVDDYVVARMAVDLATSVDASGGAGNLGYVIIQPGIIGSFSDKDRHDDFTASLEKSSSNPAAVYVFRDVFDDQLRHIATITGKNERVCMTEAMRRYPGIDYLISVDDISGADSMLKTSSRSIMINL